MEKRKNYFNRWYSYKNLKPKLKSHLAFIFLQKNKNLYTKSLKQLHKNYESSLYQMLKRVT